MSALTQTGFSYAELDPEAERVVRASATAIKAVTAHAIPEIGRHLLAAKAALPHGSFTTWTETELGIGARSARNYMQAAEWLVGKTATVSVLPPAIIYALAAPSAPVDVVNTVIEMGEVGPIDPGVVRDKLAAARDDQIELRRAQRRSPNLTMPEFRARRAKERKAAARRDEEHKQRERDERAALRASLQPLAERVAALDPGFVTELFAAVDDYFAKNALKELVAELRQAGGA